VMVVRSYSIMPQLPLSKAREGREAGASRMLEEREFEREYLGVSK
jgi:hypothetical protein